MAAAAPSRFAGTRASERLSRLANRGCAAHRDPPFPSIGLGSSLFVAQLAAALGLPFAFASHFAPGHLLEALDIYRSEFRPSPQLARPHAIVAINVVDFLSETRADELIIASQVFDPAACSRLSSRAVEKTQSSPPPRRT